MIRSLQLAVDKVVGINKGQLIIDVGLNWFCLATVSRAVFHVVWNQSSANKSAKKSEAGYPLLCTLLVN